ncbi:nucleotidyltransferase family protein [Streptomyces telluris]|uniref:Nucleotidyltransferase family protein n=1 Tax=Streptomyces telluris TaxID=2720021 RepID=A0A9X2LN01_9ACTN|nr:nucleotidyltransferase family protein [Streptomyces telluris]MCQ8774212.1 nucleotidyltransferase family protein [Streptomyces telluris]NJP77587.1 nucleotidyltransferase family protein [Streptomyces telluris]
MTATSPPVAGLLLAAGGGRRLGGRPKALLGLHGRPLVEHAARALHEGGCAPVYVVLGAAAADVRVHAGLTHCTLVDNPDWPDGMGSSLRAGLAAAAASDAGAVLVTLVDQPRVGAEAVSRVLAAHRAGAQLAAASYGGERGHPVLFARPHWQGVARAATGDRGARAYLREHAAAVTLVECGDVAGPEDVDTPEDLRLLD